MGDNISSVLSSKVVILNGVKEVQGFLEAVLALGESFSQVRFIGAGIDVNSTIERLFGRYIQSHKSRSAW